MGLLVCENRKAADKLHSMQLAIDGIQSLHAQALTHLVCRICMCVRVHMRVRVCMRLRVHVRVRVSVCM